MRVRKYVDLKGWRDRNSVVSLCVVSELRETRDKGAKRRSYVRYERMRVNSASNVRANYRERRRNGCGFGLKERVANSVVNICGV
jgi:hypothetical protein